MIYSNDDYRANVACEDARLYPEDDLYYTDYDEEEEPDNDYWFGLMEKELED